MDDMSTTMRRTRRTLLGIALLGGTGPMLAAAPRRRVAAARLDAELIAIARDPACELASLSVLAIRAGAVSYAASSAGVSSAMVTCRTSPSGRTPCFASPRSPR